ncbi:MAG TPA: cold shock domain-containing protein [Hanamia sp.]|nr:cold shock domain-containing protein [Hanamia sp.]
MAETWNKKEREKKKKQNKKDKAEKRQERRENSKNNPESMIAYLDENGNLSSTPPDPRKKIIVNVEDIEIGVPKQEEISAEELIHKGVVTFFNNEKGYGFIKDQQTNESIFVHVNSLSQPVKENNKVSFQVEMGPKGWNAIHVELVK